MATTRNLRPDLIITQEFRTPQPVVPDTVLPVCLIGLHRQFSYREYAGTFTGGMPGQQYFFPNLVDGSIVESTSATLDVPEFPDVLKPHVYIQNEYGVGEVLGGDVSYTLSVEPPYFAISPAASVTFEIATGTTGTYSSATGYFMDANADFIENMVAGGDVIEVLNNDGDYYPAFDVVDIISDDQLDVTRVNKATTPALPKATLSAEDAFGFRTLEDTTQAFQTNGVDTGDLVTVDAWDVLISVVGGSYDAAGSGTGGANSRNFTDSTATFVTSGVLAGQVIFSEDAIGDFVPFFYINSVSSETLLDDVENMVTLPVPNPALTAVGNGVPYSIFAYGAPKTLNGAATFSPWGEYGAQGLPLPPGPPPSNPTWRIFQDTTLGNYPAGTVAVGDHIILDYLAGGSPVLKPGNWPTFLVRAVGGPLPVNQLEVSQFDTNSPLPGASVLAPSFVGYEIRSPGLGPVYTNTGGSYTAEGGGGAPAGERRITATGKNFSTAGVVAGDYIRDKITGNTWFTVTTVHPAGVGTLNVQNIITGTPPSGSSNSRFVFEVTDQNPALVSVLSVTSETELLVKNVVGGTPTTGDHPGVFINSITYPDTGQDINYKIQKTVSGTNLNGDVLCTYAARRTDYAGQIVVFDKDTDVSVLGPAVPGNDIGLGANMLFTVLGTKMYFIQVAEDTNDAWEEALELAANELIYIPHIMTQREDIISVLRTHVNLYSQPEKKRERIAYFSHQEVIQTTRRADTGSMTYNKTAAGVTTLVSTAYDLSSYGVIVGDVFSGTLNDGTSDYTVTDARVISIQSGVPAAGQSTVRIVADATVPAPSSGTVANWNIKSKNLTLLERATQQADYAESINDRRVRNIWPDSAEFIFTDSTAGIDATTGTFGGGDQIATLGGHYIALIEAGKRANENPSQPLSGFPRGTIHKILDPMGDNINYQDVILDGGNYYVIHDGEDQSPKAIRAISTNVTDVFYMEDNVPPQVDSFARKLRKQIRPLLGPFVLDDPFFDLLSSQVQAVRNDVIQNKEMKDIVLLSIEEDPERADTFIMKFEVTPYISAASGLVTIYI